MLATVPIHRSRIFIQYPKLISDCLIDIEDDYSNMQWNLKYDPEEKT